MPQTDVASVLTSAQPSADNVRNLRSAIKSDATARKSAADFVASLPSDVAAAKRDGALALKKGLALWAVGRERQAIDWLRLAEGPTAREFLARALVANGRPGDALKALDQADDGAEVACLRGEAHANLGDADAVRAILTGAGKNADKADRAYLTGRADDIDGDRAGATASYEQALAADGGHVRSLFRLATNAALFGDEEDAVTLYRRAIETGDAPVNAYLNLGNLHEDRGEYSKARECYRAVVDSDPQNRRARLFLKDAQAAIHMYYDEDMERRSDRRSQVMRLPVTDFELSVRSRNCLAKMGVRTLGDLIQRSEQELLSYKNFGETSLQEIKDILAQKGLRLGMGGDEMAQDDAAHAILEGIGGDAERRTAMNRPLSDLELSVRSRHCMNVLGLKTVGDLASRSEAELMTIKNFGQTSMNEVKQKLAELGLSLAPSTTTT